MAWKGVSPSKESPKNNRPEPAPNSESRNEIGLGTVLTGDIVSQGNLRLDGKVEGNLEVQAKFASGAQAHVNGHVYAENAEVAGRVEGKLVVQELLTLKPTAVIDGDIYYGKLVVEMGAEINGNLRSNTDEMPLSKANGSPQKMAEVSQ